MDHFSVRRQRLWEAMESCRNGSDDLSDPQFADLAARLAEDPDLGEQFQRLQQADGAVKTAFARVPVPADLADRISRRLTAAAAMTIGDSVAAPSLAEPDSPTPLLEPVRGFSRRRLLVGFAALGAAAFLLGLVWIQTHRPRHDTPDSVLVDAMDFFDKDNKPFGDPVSRVLPPAEYPLSRDIVRLQDIRWRRIEKLLGDAAVAYDLPSNGGRATLYVLQRNVPGLPAFPPDNPSLSTGGKSAAAWQTGSTLYVLVVEGDAWMYSSYLDHSHGPLT